MASSPPPPADAAPVPAPRETRLASVAEQSAAIDELIALARQRIRVFDVDLSQCGWNDAARADALAHFLRTRPNAVLDIIVHDTQWLEARGARLMALLRQFAPAMTVYRTGAEAQAARDPLIIVDDRHHLHRYHIDQPRATLAIDMPQETRALAARYDEIWATGEPGLTGTQLGL